MDKRTKMLIGILVVILVICVIVAIIAFVNPFNKKTIDTGALNEMLVNEQTNDTETNNVEENVQENNVSNEENKVDNESNVTQKEEKPSTSDNANNSNEEKAIELVKKEWGEDSSVYFDLAGVTSDGKYRVSVNKDTKVLAWYIVDIASGTVTQK